MTNRAVSEYALPSDPVEEQLAYPFSRPAESFLTDGETVTSLPDTFTEFWAETNNHLLAQGLPPLEERLPVIAYGSNTNPVRLAEKMGKYARPGLELEMQTVPHIVAALPDTAVVWHGKPGQKGSTFAELYQGDEVQGEEAKAHISFLTRHQLAAMHATEGVTYHMVGLNTLAGSDCVPFQAFAYVAGNSVVLMKDGHPVKVRRTGEQALDGAMTAEEAVDYMLEQAGEAASVSTARELVPKVINLPLKEKKACQKVVGDTLGQLGVSHTFSFPDRGTPMLGRADYNWGNKHSDLLFLAEQSLGEMRPSAEEVTALKQQLIEAAERDGKELSESEALRKARTKLDIMQAVRKRAHEELEDRLSQAPEQEKTA